ncbi:MAG: hypothetical protein HYZ75_04720 [Elusimicrobia bacterium]|nr:hypothetical protein [Elusimicrobiota bacterium]
MRTSILLALILAQTGPAAAEGFKLEATAPADSVPNGMNYQGRLEKDGFPLTGTKPMVFRLYDVATGGSALWASGTLSIVAVQGLFAASLDIPFTALGGNTQKYLEIEVDGNILAPRDPLRSVPYAKIAESVEGSIDVSSAGLTFTTPAGNTLAISSGPGRVGIGTNVPLALLHVASGTGETGNILLVSTGASTLMSVNGNGRVTANSYAGDGSFLSNVVRKTGDGMTGPLTLNASTLTVGGAAMSVGGSDLVVASNRIGVRTTNPTTTFEVNGNAQFGSAAAKSTFSTTGALSLDSNASLSVGTTFFVNSGRVGIGTITPGTSLHVVGGDVYIGNPAVHDTSAAPDLLVEGNFILDGKLIQHAGAMSVFEQLGVGAEPQAGQTFAVGFASFSVTTGGNVGVGVAAPLAKLSVVGDSSFSQPATFGSSVTAVGNVGVGGNLGVGVAAPLAKLSVVGDSAFTQPASFGSSVTVRAAAAFGTGAGTIVSAAGALTLTNAQNINVSGGGQLLGLPASPSATGAASKEYVDAASGGVSTGTGWTRDVPNTAVRLLSIGDRVGIGVAVPLAKLSVVGDSSFSLPATFASSVTLVVPLAVAGGGTGNATGQAVTATSLAANGANCNANEFNKGVNAAGAAESCATLLDADIPNDITINAAGTATSLAANGANCNANEFNKGVNAAGAAESCATLLDADVPDDITITLAATATSLAANGANCNAGEFNKGVSATGAAESCAALLDSDVPDTITVNAANVAAGTLTGAFTHDTTLTLSGGAKLVSTGADPVVSVCGTGPAIVGSDAAGKVTVGLNGAGDVNSCTLTFSSAYAAAPACAIVGSDNLATLGAVTTTGDLTFTSTTNIEGTVVMYVCVGL